RVLGTDVTEHARSVRERIGLLPEGFDGVPNLSAREHVSVAVETKGADDDPDALLERVGLDPDDARRPADDYSTGMHRRMALAVALVGEPDLIVLDEPSAGLDPNGVKLVRRIVREEADRGATVFFSSHILDAVASLPGMSLSDSTRALIGALSPAGAYFNTLPELVWAGAPSQYEVFAQFEGTSDALAYKPWFNVLVMVGWAVFAPLVGYVRFRSAELG
ncbi:hypothetical protein BRD06_05715, partial [Halobacteriales archaeon QS_9_67_15]